MLTKNVYYVQSNMYYIYKVTCNIYWNIRLKPFIIFLAELTWNVYIYRHTWVLNNFYIILTPHWDSEYENWNL